MFTFGSVSLDRIGATERTPSRSNRSSRIRKLFSLLPVFLILSCSGCGKKEVRLPTHKVSGKVTLAGVGLPNATVIFHSKNPVEGFIKPRATTKENGEFEMTTYESGDGSPVGDYDVTISQWLAIDPAAGAKNQLPPELSVPETSGFKASVKEADNVLPAFEIP
jgi:hypothetical protein